MNKRLLWYKTRRVEQIEPQGDWSIWLIMAGRGFGKTRTGAQWVLEKLLSGQNISIGIMGSSMSHLYNVMLYGESGIIYNSWKKIKVTWHKKFLQYRTNRCFLFTDKSVEDLRGHSLDYIWIDELCKYKSHNIIVDQCLLCLRKGHSKMVITTTPKDIPIIHSLINSKDVYLTTGSTFSNRENLSHKFLNNIEKIKNTPIGKQEIYGEIENNWSQWKKSDFLYNTSVSFDCISIGIDPAIGVGTTGIIIVGILDNKFFILEDISQNTSISDWGELLKDKYLYYEKNYCDVVINIEINQGGEILVSTLKMIHQHFNIRTHRASLSKLDRRIKLLYLYGKKRIFHNHNLSALEEEMLNEPKDRVDALVWAVEIFHNNINYWSI